MIKTGGKGITAHGMLQTYNTKNMTNIQSYRKQKKYTKR